MDKLKVMVCAKQILEEADLEKVESLNITSTTYADGTTGVSIDLTYIAEEKEETTYYADGEEITV